MLWHSSKKNLNYELKIILLFVGSCAIIHFFGITCIVYYLTKIPCPTCGMTRALFSLIIGDIQGYIQYNAMALPVALVFLGELFHKRFACYQIVLHGITLLVLVGNLVYYTVRLYHCF